MIQLELSCTGSQCQDDMKAQITQLDITENELKARKYNSAISSAAILKADCLNSGESSESCNTVAETEFMLLSSNLMPDTKTRFMINTLTLQKQNGELTELKKRKGRAEFQRGIIYKKNNKNYVKTVGEQGSGILSSMTRANCLIYLPVEQGKVKLNDKVQILMFKEYI